MFRHDNVKSGQRIVIENKNEHDFMMLLRVPTVFNFNILIDLTCEMIRVKYEYECEYSLLMNDLREYSMMRLDIRPS